MSKMIFSIAYLIQTLRKRNALQEKNKANFLVKIEILSGNNQLIITETRKGEKTSKITIVIIKDGIKEIDIIKIEDIIKEIVIISIDIMEVIDIMEIIGIMNMVIIIIMIKKIIEEINIIKEIKGLEMINMMTS